MTEYEVKEEILNRLHERVGECMHCGRVRCCHGSNTELPGHIWLDDLIWAIDLDSVDHTQTGLAQPTNEIS